MIGTAPLLRFLRLSALTFPVAIAAMFPSPNCAMAADDRTEIVLDAGERELLLKGMRTYLESIQGIVAALAENRAQDIAPIASRSGAKLLQTVSPVTAAKLPLAFMSMSFDTHDKFDKLAARAAKQTSRGEVLSDLRDVLANCTSCHMTFKAVAPK